MPTIIPRSVFGVNSRLVIGRDLPTATPEQGWIEGLTVVPTVR